MVDRLNQINSQQLLGIQSPDNRPAQPGKTADGNDFQTLLMSSINDVNRMQDEAEKATTDLVTGKNDNVDEVFTAVRKAELAFQTLMQIRNKLMDAYEEIKQMRV